MCNENIWRADGFVTEDSLESFIFLTADCWEDALSLAQTHFKGDMTRLFTMKHPNPIFYKNGNLCEGYCETP